MNDYDHRSMNHRKRKSSNHTTVMTTTDDVDMIRNDHHDPGDTSPLENEVMSDTVVVEVAPTQPSYPFLPLRQLRLEAVFYPKFENEQLSPRPSKNTQPNSASPSVREQMIERCLSSNTNDNNHASLSESGDHSSRHGHGYMEVSIKHSGSLVLWSGDSRYYSKNSTDNAFTHTCELLLRQHFYHYAIATASDRNTTISDTTTVIDTAKELYNTCSQYIVQHRLTLSFEVVTSVLGDHGARPMRDYILLTAIADRNRITPQHHHHHQMFYTTLEIIEFAQTFHLPHNDYWVYTNALSIQHLFQVYDTSRETGTTSTILPALTTAATYNQRNLDSTISVDGSNIDTSVCDYYIQSMYPHDRYQGEILEGIVIRFVHFPAPSQSSNTAATDGLTANATNDDIIEQIKKLSRNSRTIVHQFTNASEPARQDPSSSDSEQDFQLHSMFTTNLRSLYDETKALYSKKGLELFEERVRHTLHDTSKHHDRQVVIQRVANDPLSTLSMSKQLPIWVETLLQQQESKTHDHSKQKRDIETYQIAKLIHEVTQISKNVTYAIYEEKESNDAKGDADKMISTGVSRYICIVHVLHDQTFHKYHRSKNETDLPLFRGFSFELIGGNQSETAMSSYGDHPNADNQSIVHRKIATNDSKMEDETLMLKMKFLPYMVRRNEL